MTVKDGATNVVPIDGSAPVPVTPPPAELVPGSREERVDHAVHLGITAFNEGRFEEAAAWFRDAAAHCESVKKERLLVHEATVAAELKAMLEKNRV